MEILWQLLWAFLLGATAFSQAYDGVALQKVSTNWVQVVPHAQINVTIGRGASLKFENYTIGRGDGGKTIVFNCSSACTATLRSATRVGPNFGVRILSIGDGTVTITSSSAVIGGITILKSGHAEVSSDGHQFYSSNTKKYTSTMNRVQSGDSLINPAPNSNFASTHTLPANLPAGTFVRITYGGFYKTTAARVATNWNISTGPAGTGTQLCHGENLTIKVANGNGGSAPFFAECHFVVRTSGTSGSLWGMNITHYWYGDTYFGAEQGGPNYPGYDITGSQPMPFGFEKASAGQTYDTTLSKTLYIYNTNAGTNTTWYLAEFNLEISLP
jgi:hypothetical protein